VKRFATICAVLTLAASLAHGQLVDGVAAIVDKDVILLSEVEFSAGMMLQQIKAQQNGQPIPPELIMKVYQDALQGLIDNKLIQRFAERAQLRATPEEIDRAVTSIAGEEGVTPEEIYQAAAAQGLSEADYRNELGKQITRMKVISGSVQQRVTVTDEEVKALFDERYGNQDPGMRVRVRHILLLWPEDLTPEKKERALKIADTIRERAIETGDFATLALQYSKAPSAADGGLTTFREGDVSPEIAEAVFNLPPGEVTQLIETEHGLNMFQIVNRFDPADVAFEDVEPNLYAELVERKTMPEFQDWINDLRKNRYIEIVKPELR